MPLPLTETPSPLPLPLHPNGDSAKLTEAAAAAVAALGVTTGATTGAASVTRGLWEGDACEEEETLLAVARAVEGTLLVDPSHGPDGAAPPEDVIHGVSA
ncbi:hypothetical protein Vretimale_3445 [Volvox reticuliferus]|uniref:Uncharacterized protein n=1 Tax=Volvox reticuliferus TaxID=1737510 RepID=A0A8J4G3P6_9CHLO|nr:hypothetical protein Vretimale_3445 [Volvox reticuliferus]